MNDVNLNRDGAPGGGQVVVINGRPFDPRRGLLASEGGTRGLPPAHTRLLTLLVTHAGKPLNREWLLEQAWPGGEVSDEALSKAVSLLRRTLGDRRRRVIETVHGFGYVLHPEYMHEIRADAPPTVSADVGSSTWHGRAGRWVSVFAVLTGTALAAWLWPPLHRSPGAINASSVESTAQPVNLTYQPGRELFPQLSPDGRWFTYITGDEPSRLVVQATHDPGVKWLVAEDALAARWCPDGEHLAWSENDGNRGFVILTAQRDGSARQRVATTRIHGNLEWLPDHSALLYSDFQAPGAINLFRHPLIEGQARTPLLPMTPPAIHVDPRVSPDGRWLAFRAGAFPNSRLVVADLRAGLRTVWKRAPGEQVRSMDWSADSRHLFAFMEYDGQPGIWRMGVADDAATPELVQPTPRLGFLSSARSRSSLVYSYPELDTGIATLLVSSERLDAEEVIDSSESDTMPSLSPDGRTLAFLSDRTGQWAAWVQIAPGIAPVQLHTSSPPLQVAPAWSADGERLAFMTGDASGAAVTIVPVVSEGQARLIRLPAGFQPQALALAGADDVPVVAGLMDSERPVVLAHPGDQWRTLANLDAVHLQARPGDPHLYAAEASGYGVWRISLDGRAHTHLEWPINPLTLRRWSLGETRLLVSRGGPTGQWLETWTLDGDVPHLAHRLELPLEGLHERLSASLDGRHVAVDRMSDLEANVRWLDLVERPSVASR